MTALSFTLEEAGGSGRKFVHSATQATLFLYEPHPDKTLKLYRHRPAPEGKPLMSSTLRHRGYHGSVLFSAEDKCLHGRVLGIRDMISYGGSTISELERNFTSAVDEYLAFCEEAAKPQTSLSREASTSVSRMSSTSVPPVLPKNTTAN